MTIEIVSFPIKNGGSFHSYVNVYQRLAGGYCQQWSKWRYPGWRILLTATIPPFVDGCLLSLGWSSLVFNSCYLYIYTHWYTYIIIIYIYINYIYYWQITYHTNQSDQLLQDNQPLHNTVSLNYWCVCVLSSNLDKMPCLFFPNQNVLSMLHMIIGYDYWIINYYWINQPLLVDNQLLTDTVLDNQLLDNIGYDYWIINHYWINQLLLVDNQLLADTVLDNQLLDNIGYDYWIINYWINQPLLPSGNLT